MSTAPAATDPSPRPPRRWLRIALLTAAALLLGAALLLVWLLGSGHGRDAALRQLQALLGADMQLVWTRAEGTLASGLVLQGVTLDSAAVQARAVRVELVPAWRSLWAGELRVERLALQTVELGWPASDSADDAAPMDWPPPAPDLGLPLDLRLDALAIDQLTLIPPDGAPLTLSDIATAATLDNAGATLAPLRLTAPQGRLTLQARVGFQPQWPVALQAALTQAATADGPARQLSLSAEGSLDALTLHADGALPGALRLDATLRDGRGTPAWTLQLQADALDAALLGLDGPPLALTLDGRGVGADATLQGHARHGTLDLAIDPLQLRWTAPRLEISTLAATLAPYGPLQLQGWIEPGDPLRLDLALQSDGLQLAAGSADAPPSRLSISALTLRGTPDDWRLDGHGGASGAGTTADWQLRAEGDPQGARLDEARLATAAGRAELAGRIGWQGGLDWTLDGRLAELDPAVLLPEYPGRLNATLHSTGAQPDGGALAARVVLSGLDGTLRERPLRGDLTLDWQDTAGTLDLDLALGDSRLAAAGQVGERLDLDLRLDPLQLQDLHPQGGGRLRGHVAVRGPAAAPALRGQLAGEALRWGDNLRVGQLTLDGGLPADGRDQLRLDASAITLAGRAPGTLALRLDGHRAAFDARMDWTSPEGTLALQAGVALPASGWQITVDDLALRHPDAGEAVLDGATHLRGGPGGHLDLGPACLQLRPKTAAASDAGARLCADGRWPDGITLRSDPVPLALLDPWLQRDGVQLHLDGSARLDATVRGGAAVALDARLALESGALRVLPDGRRPALAWDGLQATLRADTGGLAATLDADLAGDDRLAATLTRAPGDDGALDGRLDLQLADLTALELLSPDIAQPTGRLAGQLTLGGTASAPQLDGQLSLAGFRAEVPALGVVLRDGRLDLSQAADGRLALDGRLHSGDGWVDVAGTVDWQGDAGLDLAIRGEALQLADTPDLQATLSPDLQLTATADRVRVRGQVDVPRARIALDRLDSGASASSDVLVLDPVEPAQQAAAALDLDLRIGLGENVRLAGFGLDGRIDGQLRLRQRPGRAALASGALDVTGRYRAYGQDLDITRARLSYANAPPDNPALDIRARRVFEQQTVGVRVSGTALAPQTVIESDPVLETTEALSWLVLGRPLQSATGGDGEKLNAAAMALGAGGNLIAEKLGARLGFDAAGISDSRALGGSTLTVGKYLSPRLLLSYGVSLLGAGQMVSLKYLLGGGFDVEVESGTQSAASLNYRIER